MLRCSLCSRTITCINAGRCISSWQCTVIKGKWRDTSQAVTSSCPATANSRSDYRARRRCAWTSRRGWVWDPLDGLKGGENPSSRDAADWWADQTLSRSQAVLLGPGLSPCRFSRPAVPGPSLYHSAPAALSSGPFWRLLNYFVLVEWTVRCATSQFSCSPTPCDRQRTTLSIS